jgi:hypothetical protein
MGFLDELRKTLRDTWFAMTLTGQVSSEGVQSILAMARDPNAKEYIIFFEDDALRPAEPNWVADLMGEFHDDPKLGIGMGDGMGNAFIRTAYLKKVLQWEKEPIRDYASLARAFMKHGYLVVRLGYIHCNVLAPAPAPARPAASVSARPAAPIPAKPATSVPAGPGGNPYPTSMGGVDYCVFCSADLYRQPVARVPAADMRRAAAQGFAPTDKALIRIAGQNGMSKAETRQAFMDDVQGLNDDWDTCVDCAKKIAKLAR